MKSRVSIALLWLLLESCQLPAPRQSQQIQIGVCTRLADLDANHAAGFDFLELRTYEIVALSDVEFEALIFELEQKGIHVPATYLFIPGDIKLTGPNIDKDRQMAYVTRAFDRVSRLGARVINFGSGGARSRPEGFSREQAFEQLVEFGKRIAPEAQARNITIAVEQMRPEESNMINSLAESLELVRAIDHPNFQLMVDYYHLVEVNEDPAVILEAGDHIRHIHMANPIGRVFPLSAEEFDYAPFFANLRQIGYTGNVSLEATTEDLPREGSQAIAFLRNSLTSK